MPAIHPSCPALSSRNANCEVPGAFLHETFSRCPQAGLVIHKIAVFPGENCASVLSNRGFLVPSNYFKKQR